MKKFLILACSEQTLDYQQEHDQREKQLKPSGGVISKKFSFCLQAYLPAFGVRHKAALSASQYFRCLLPLPHYTVCSRTSFPWCPKEFICQDQHNLFLTCTWRLSSLCAFLARASHKCSTVAVDILISVFLPCELKNRVLPGSLCAVGFVHASAVFVLWYYAPRLQELQHCVYSKVVRPLQSKLVALASSHFRICFGST